MKKLFLALGIFSFLLFGVISVQNVTAAVNGVDIVVVDNDDDDDKKKNAAAKKSDDSKVTMTKVEGESHSGEAKCASKEAACKTQCKSSEAKSSCKEAKSCKTKCPDKK